MEQVMPTQLEAVPAEPPKFLDLLQEYLIGANGLPAGWKVVSMSVREQDAPNGHARIEGAVCPDRKTGGVNWRKRERGTERIVFYKLADFHAWEQAKADAAGVCVECWGTGKTVASVSINGKTYRTCRKCNGAGK